MKLNKGFNSGSVAWQLHDHNLNEMAKCVRWMDRVFSNLKHAFIKFNSKLEKPKDD